MEAFSAMAFKQGFTSPCIWCFDLTDPLTGKFPGFFAVFIVNPDFWLPRHWIGLNFAEKASYLAAWFPWRLGTKMYKVLLWSMRLSQNFIFLIRCFFKPFSFPFPPPPLPSPLLLLIAFALHVLSDSRCYSLEMEPWLTLAVLGHFTTNFAPKTAIFFLLSLRYVFSLRYVRMRLLSKTNSFANRPILAVLSAYQKYLLTPNEGGDLTSGTKCKTPQS